jgi:hypothetical protein
MKGNENMTRRGILRRVGIAGTLPVMGTALSPRKADAARRKAAAFALVGDRYHNSDYIRTALGKTLVREAGLSIDFTDEVTSLNSETLRGYRMLIVFRDGMLWPDGYIGSYAGYEPGKGPELRSEPPLPPLDGKPVMWIKPEQGRAVKEFVQRGGAALFYHNVSHVSLGDKDFRDVEGAGYAGHPAVRAFRLHITNRDHPITRGVNDFLVTDEQHYVTYDKNPQFVFLRSENVDGLDYDGKGSSCEAGWAYDYGKGRVCFLAPGHMISVLWNPEYEKLQKNAIRWLLREI